MKLYVCSLHPFFVLRPYQLPVMRRKMQGKYPLPPDAYGHMEYGVGFGGDPDSSDEQRGDWYAYADFQLSECGRFVWYHVIVNSESGAFIDIVEERELSRPRALKELPGLLNQYLDIAIENLAGCCTEGAPTAAFTADKIAENQTAIKKWQQIVHDMLDLKVSYKLNLVNEIENIWEYVLYENDTAVANCGAFGSYSDAKKAAVFHKFIHEDELRKKGFTA